MGKIKRMVSTVMAVMVALNIFVGLAAAEADVIVEPPDVSDTGAYTITCPNYGISLVYQADTYPELDKDRFKCSVNAQDKIYQFIEDTAFQAGTAGNAYSASGKLVESWSKYGGSGDNIVDVSPVYPIFSNVDSQIYYGYQFFIARNWP